jgi:hypothetical protein
MRTASTKYYLRLGDEPSSFRNGRLHHRKKKIDILVAGMSESTRLYQSRRPTTHQHHGYATRGADHSGAVRASPAAISRMNDPG